MTDSAQRGAHGRSLMAFVDNELVALGEAPTSWARRHDITASNLGKWRDGDMDPTLPALEDVAAALGRPLVDLLIAAGYITPDEVGGRTVMPTPPPDVSHAIENDSSLTEVERQVLRSAVALAIGARDGQTRQRKTIKIE